MKDTGPEVIGRVFSWLATWKQDSILWNTIHSELIEQMARHGTLPGTLGADGALMELGLASLEQVGSDDDGPLYRMNYGELMTRVKNARVSMPKDPL